MHFPSLLGLLALTASTTAVSVSYDEGYDLSGRSMNDVACSDGENGLITRFGWKTQGQTSNFPNIGGAPSVAGWNSPGCGGCWQLSYKGHTVNVMAVDVAVGGYVIGLKAMDALTNGQGKQLGRVEAKATKVKDSLCGIKA